MPSDNSHDQQIERAEHGREEHQLAELLRSSGPRPEPPVADVRRIKSSARSEWQALVDARQRRWRPLRLLVPATAAVLAVLAILIWNSRQPTVAPRSAVVELVRGAAWQEEVGTASKAESRLAVADSLVQGVEIVTGDAPEAAVNVVAIRLAGGQSLRLGSGTRIALSGPSRLELLSGLVYVDSPDSETATTGLEIGTPLGTVVDIGTQFLVALADSGGESLTVRVRRGAVEVHQHQGAHGAEAGEEIRLLEDGSVTRGACAATGAQWSWILSAAPAFDLEGASLAAFLDWAVRETGWRLRYADGALARAAAGIELHGTIEGLRPDEAVEAVLPGAGLVHRLEGDELVVARSQRELDAR